MNEKIKAILSFFVIILICLSASAGGVMLISYAYGLIYLSLLVIIIPILAVISIIHHLKTMARG